MSNKGPKPAKEKAKKIFSLTMDATYLTFLESILAEEYNRVTNEYYRPLNMGNRQALVTRIQKTAWFLIRFQKAMAKAKLPTRRDIVGLDKAVLGEFNRYVRIQDGSRAETPVSNRRPRRR